MKNKFSLILAIATIALGSWSCIKKTDPVPASNSTKPTDQSGTNEANAALDDVRDIINNKIGGGAGQRIDKSEAYNLPCGIISIDSSTTSNNYKVYKINYGQSTPCGYKYKSGKIDFQLIAGTKFSDVDAKYKVTFTNYIVEVKANGQVVKLNGTSIVTNTSGGYIYQAVTENKTITHKIRSSFVITYNNTVVRPRSVYETRAWSSNNSWAGLTFTANGDTLINNINVSEIGKTYDGNYDFQTQITEPWSWSNCGTTFAGPYVLKTGKAKVDVTIPNLSPTYYSIEAGYKWDVSNLSTTPVSTKDCASNAYKIDLVIGTTTSTEYQLY